MGLENIIDNGSIQSNDYELHTKAKSNNEPLIFAFDEVRARLLLCQDLTASTNIRPVRPVRGPGEEGRIHHDLQGLLRPRHADGLPYLTTADFYL